MMDQQIAEARSRLAAWDEAWKYDTGLGLRDKRCQDFIAHAPADLRAALDEVVRLRIIALELVDEMRQGPYDSDALDRAEADVRGGAAAPTP